MQHFWISAKPMTVCPFQLYCINYHVLAYQKILCRGLQRFFNPESNACRLMDKNPLGRYKIWYPPGYRSWPNTLPHLYQRLSFLY